MSRHRMRPLCVYCDKPQPLSVTMPDGRKFYGFQGSGFFCSMRCAAEWGNSKAEGTSWDNSEDFEKYQPADYAERYGGRS